VTASRQTVREALAASLATAYSAVSAVYDHKPDKLSGSPAVLVLSAGSDRTRGTTQGFGAVFFFEIRHLVLHMDAATGWTEEDAEDALDTMDLELARWMDDVGNRKTANWKSVRFIERSLVVMTELAGKPYIQESHQMAVHVP
jgi:hypothetical protein